MNRLCRTLSFLCIPALVLLLSSVSGCMDNIWRGQVATVNGNPITLDQVTALRNSTHFDWTSSTPADQDVMRKQYGDALTNLIAVELVKQQLAKKKLSVTVGEVLSEENLIRADYPPGTFEEVLVGEAIDLETWRFLLHNHLSVQRFLDKVLLPDIVITLEETDAYLKAHPRAFLRPPWAFFFLVTAAEQKSVDACAKDLDADSVQVQELEPDALIRTVRMVQELHPDALIRTVRMDINRLDPMLGDALVGLEPGGLSPVIEFGGEFHRILLLKRLPERQADPNETYLQIQKTLVGQKLQAQYNEWVRSRIQKATIKVSQQLLPHLRSSIASPGQDSTPDSL